MSPLNGPLSTSKLTFLTLSNCELDNFLINAGVYATSIGGALNGVVSFMFRFNNKWVNECKPEVAINNKQNMGICAGDFMKSFLNAESPSFFMDSTASPFGNK